MNHSRSLARILFTSALTLAVSATSAPAQQNSRYDYHNHSKPFGKYGPTFSYPSPTKMTNVLNGRPANATPRRVAQRTTPSRAGQSPTTRSKNTSAQTTRLSDLNLSITTPPGPWVQSDLRETGSKARYLISRDDPAINISLAGERVGTLATDTNVSLLEKSQAKMMTMPGAVVEPGERRISAGPIDGIAHAATVSNGQFTTYYAIWVAAHNGYNYKLAVYGEQRDKTAIDAALRNFLHGMKPLDATRTARGNGNQRTARR